MLKSAIALIVVGGLATVALIPIQKAAAQESATGTITQPAVGQPYSWRPRPGVSPYGRYGRAWRSPYAWPRYGWQNRPYWNTRPFAGDARPRLPRAPEPYRSGQPHWHGTLPHYRWVGIPEGRHVHWAADQAVGRG